MERMGVCKPILSAFRRLACGFSTAFLLLLPASAQLSPEAQKDYAQGVAAVKQQSWAQAVTSFAAAQALAPREPSVLYALALANDNAGNGLDADAWFRAYLAAAPDASVAAEVRSEIASLDDSNVQTMKKIFANALTVARQIPSADMRWWGLFLVAEEQALAGLIDDALVTVQEADSLARTIPQKTLAQPDGSQIPIPSLPAAQSGLWEDYAEYMIDMHNLPKAQESLGHITDPRIIISAKMQIATAFAFKADNVNAEKLLAEVKAAIGSLPDPKDQVTFLIALADSYTEMHKPGTGSLLISNAKALALKSNLNMQALEPAFSNALVFIMQAQQGNYYEDHQSNHIDEVNDRIAVAGQISQAGVDASVAEGLKQVNPGDPGIGTATETGDLAMKLAQDAVDLGQWLIGIESLDAVEYKRVSR